MELEMRMLKVSEDRKAFGWPELLSRCLTLVEWHSDTNCATMHMTYALVYDFDELSLVMNLEGMTANS